MFSRTSRTALPLLFAAAVTAVVLVSPIRPVRSAVQANDLSSEAARIGAHLARVEAELQSRDVSALSPAQESARRVQIARLHEYRLRGKFPHNHELQGRRVPFFSDRHGTLCAMAYLIEASGRHDIVKAVSARSNNARIIELAADPELGPGLVTWLEGAGLTVAEAQRIQPSYYYGLDEESRIPTEYGVASGALGAVNLVSIAANGGRAITGRGPAWASPVGMATGAGQMVLGATSFDKEGERRVLGIANVVVGFASFVASALAITKSPSNPSASSRVQSPTVRPMVYALGTTGSGLGIRASF